MSPIYSYQCVKCGYLFDDLLPMNSTSELPCRRPAGADDTLDDSGEDDLCDGTAFRIPSVPSPAVFRCSMPTPQKPREGI
jgi:hypothetical protein